VSISSLLTLSLSLLAGGEAPQWGGFRGNNGAGTGSATRLPATLDPEGNLMWRMDVPSGYSSPTIAGKDLYLTGTDDKAKLFTLCLDAYSGEERWRKELAYDGKRPGQNSPAAPSPATDGEHVYALFHHVGLVAYDKTGKELWKKPLGPFNIPHGLSTSPVLHGDLVILQVDQDDGAYLVAYDKLTGAERWKIERPGVAHGYATPAVYEPAGRAPELVVSSSFQIAGYSLDKGEKLWWVDGAGWQSKAVPVFAGGQCFVNAYIPTIGEMQYGSLTGTFEEALAAHDADKDGKLADSEWPDEKLRQLWFLFDKDGDRLVDADDFEFGLRLNRERGALFAIQPEGKGDLTQKGVRWKLEDRRVLSDSTSPVILDGFLYIVTDGGILTAVDLASGKPGKQERVGDSDSYFASPVAGDGKLYLCGLQGQLAVVKAGAEWEVLSVTHLEEGTEVWATPALAGHAVYVRAKNALYCFEDPD